MILRRLISVRLVGALAGFGVALSASSFPIHPPAPRVIEMVNEITGHYVLLADGSEIAAVEAGSAGPGWRKTGYSFEVALPRDAVVDGNVCRFYAPGPNTHFYTADPVECAFLRNNDTGWIFERFEFFAMRVQGGTCEFMQSPVYRLYNNRWMFNDSNHRYTPDPDVRARMLAQGWVDEGIAFCVRAWHRQPEKTFTVTADEILPGATHCENEAVNVGSCTALNHLQPMPNSVMRFLLPSLVPNPEFPAEVERVIGDRQLNSLWTGQPLPDRGTVAAHSFVQDAGRFTALFGIHLSSRDRTTGDYAAISPLYNFQTRPIAPGQAVERIVPWKDGQDAELHVSFQLAVHKLLRLDPTGHAYGHPTLQFVDRGSGMNLYVTLSAYGSNDSADLVARDVATGHVIVGTTFRTAPAFGRRVVGDRIDCSGNGPCGPSTLATFKFVLDRAAFGRVLELGRTLEPRLSADPSDFHLANFQFRNEVFRSAELGVRLGFFTLQIHGPAIATRRQEPR